MEARFEQLPDERGVKVQLLERSAPIAFGRVIERWAGDAAFRTEFSAWIAGSALPAVRWETPPITLASAGRPFEFVLLASPWLDVDPSPADFDEHFASSSEPVLTFANLGGDARLVVPRPMGSTGAHGHLATFLRAGPPDQVDALWAAVGRAVRRRLSDRPVWVSTAGGGVPWLHVRLDDRPKYYGHEPYREPPA